MSVLIGFCEHCGVPFQYCLLHNGFNDSAYAYCDKCPFSAVLNWSHTSELVGLELHQRIASRIEPFLRPCPCGGDFRAAADPKCPACGVALSAEKAASYIEPNAPATGIGWKWQRTWAGVYSIILDDKVVRDWWDEQAIRNIPDIKP